MEGRRREKEGMCGRVRRDGGREKVGRRRRREEGEGKEGEK